MILNKNEYTKNSTPKISKKSISYDWKSIITNLCRQNSDYFYLIKKVKC